eukprot:PhF_6_TR21185/c0_g1_i1/m.30546
MSKRAYSPTKLRKEDDSLSEYSSDFHNHGGGGGGGGAHTTLRTSRRKENVLVGSDCVGGGGGIPSSSSSLSPPEFAPPPPSLAVLWKYLHNVLMKVVMSSSSSCIVEFPSISFSNRNYASHVGPYPWSRYVLESIGYHPTGTHSLLLVGGVEHVEDVTSFLHNVHRHMNQIRTWMLQYPICLAEDHQQQPQQQHDSSLFGFSLALKLQRLWLRQTIHNGTVSVALITSSHYELWNYVTSPTIGLSSDTSSTLHVVIMNGLYPGQARSMMMVNHNNHHNSYRCFTSGGSELTHTNTVAVYVKECSCPNAMSMHLPIPVNGGSGDVFHVLVVWLEPGGCPLVVVSLARSLLFLLRNVLGGIRQRLSSSSSMQNTVIVFLTGGGGGDTELQREDEDEGTQQVSTSSSVDTIGEEFGYRVQSVNRTNENVTVVIFVASLGATQPITKVWRTTTRSASSGDGSVPTT